jgi:hypothetical protein
MSRVVDRRAIEVDFRRPDWQIALFDALDFRLRAWMDPAGQVHVWPAEADEPKHVVDWTSFGLTCDCGSETACPHRARAWAEYEQLWRDLVAVSRSHGLIAAVRFAVYDQTGEISSQPIRPVRDVLLWRDRDGAHANIILLQRHSTTVDWGYVGAGPTELARSILTHFYGPATAIALYRDFVREVIAVVPYSVDEYVLAAETIRRWVEAKVAQENEEKEVAS